MLIYINDFMAYFVYIVKCKDKTLYTGYTTDLEKRITAHNTSKTGAKYTKARRPVKLVYSKKFKTLSEALKNEYKIKSLTKKEKLKLCKIYTQQN